MTSIAVVAHPERRDDANRLAEKVDADAVFWDRESKGCEFNHMQAWGWHAMMAAGETRGFKVVLEDDAVPVNGFRDQLERVLAVTPADVVSLYLGTGYPKQWQDSLRTAVPPETDPHFLIAPELLSCVGYAVRSKWATAVHSAATRAFVQKIPIDASITQFCRLRLLKVAYSRPSIVNHLDEHSLVQERRDGQGRDRMRRAWKFGTRPEWESTSLVIPEPKLVRVDGQGKWYETEARVYE